MHKKVKVLLISDKKNWSYAAIAQSVMKFNNSDNLRLSHISCKRNIDKIRRMRNEYDLFFVLGWQNVKSLPFIDKSRTITGVHSHQSFDNKSTTVNEDHPPSEKFVDYLRKFRSVNTVSLRLHKLLQHNGLSCVYTPNGVDTDVFKPLDRKGVFTASCVAAEKNDWNKGVKKFIGPACKLSGAKLINAGSNKINNNKMPDFYNRSHCYICASQSEGMPMSVLEASACGCVIISTKCGDIIHLIKNGKNGFLVNRNVEDIRNRLEYIKNPDVWKDMSDCIRQNIVDKWSWAANAPKWIKFIEMSNESS